MKRVGIAVGLAVAQLSCHQAILTAPTGSTLTLIANPQFIPANGGVSVISALLIEPAGTVVPDGTVVQFFTNLGEIESQGKTNDGVARVNLVAGPLSGTATVTAVSGAAETVQEEVVIGSARPTNMVLTADPPVLEAPGFVRIVANVFDEFGNPVPNVPVIFDVSQDSAAAEFTERMESGGAPVFTNNNGQAIDELVSEQARDAPAKSVTVRATVTAIASPSEITVPIE